MEQLSVAIIGSDDSRRTQLAEAVKALDHDVTGVLPLYPSPGTEKEIDLARFDVVLLELDAQQDFALELISNISSQDSSITVMAYSASRDPELVVRCMRAGAREFLKFPFDKSQLSEALERVAARRPQTGRFKAARKLFAFWGAKGGVGTTTLASNFAMALHQESGQKVALVDLNVQLGDVAMTLGVDPQFSVIDALESAHRLDHEFLSALMVAHQSGISVLAGPDHFVTDPAIHNGNLSVLFRVLQDEFPYVVADAGPGLGVISSTLLEHADRVYLVTEADVPTLRNTQRLMVHLHSKNGRGPRIDLVLNRFRARNEIHEKRIVEALGVAVNWRIPNDYVRVQEALNRGVPVAETHSAVMGVLRQMARLACGKSASSSRKSTWSIRLRKYAAQPWIISKDSKDGS